MYFSAGLCIILKIEKIGIDRLYLPNAQDINGRSTNFSYIFSDGRAT